MCLCQSLLMHLMSPWAHADRDVMIWPGLVEIGTQFLHKTTDTTQLRGWMVIVVIMSKAMNSLKQWYITSRSGSWGALKLNSLAMATRWSSLCRAVNYCPCLPPWWSRAEEKCKWYGQIKICPKFRRNYGKYLISCFWWPWPFFCSLTSMLTEYWPE